MPEHLRTASDLYIRSMFRAFDSLDFLTLETNPFTFIEHEGVWRPLFLDMVAEVDDTAKFKVRRAWWLQRCARNCNNPSSLSC